MGINYYAVRTRPTVNEPIHIGKYSGGWLFLFRVQDDKWTDPTVVWNTYEQVKDWLKKHTVDSKEYVILDEYDQEISFDDLFQLIDSTQKDEESLSNPDNFKYNTQNINGYRFYNGEFS